MVPIRKHEWLISKVIEKVPVGVRPLKRSDYDEKFALNGMQS